ncbi:aminoacyl-tRNA hydrolase [bacterium]|nr:aminoacyl-tRNA hydrolase [bacterium]
MILIVGLGNPGTKYLRTRHNIGFRVLDGFQRENNFPNFELAKKFNSLISQGKISGKKILLAKPQTFMNNSGKAVKSLTHFYKITSPGNIVIVHDDIDLPLGKIRIAKNRGSAGHKGVESIIKELGTKDFARIRVGIRNKELGIRETEKYVLQKFTKEEEKIIKKIIKRTCQALKMVLVKEIEKVMNKFNK